MILHRKIEFVILIIWSLLVQYIKMIWRSYDLRYFKIERFLWRVFNLNDERHLLSWIIAKKNLREYIIIWLLNSPSQRHSREDNLESVVGSHQRIQYAYMFYDPQECIQFVRFLSPQRIIISRDEPLDKRSNSKFLCMLHAVSIDQYGNAVSLKQIWTNINLDVSDFLLAVLPSEVSRTSVKKTWWSNSNNSHVLPTHWALTLASKHRTDQSWFS